MILFFEDVIIKYTGQLVSQARDCVKDDTAVYHIVEGVFDAFIEKTKRIKFATEESLSHYLRLLTIRFCNNYNHG